MRVSLLWCISLGVLAATAGCVGEATDGTDLDGDEDVVESEQEVVNGQIDSGHPAVGRVYLTVGNTVAKCTGTLIGARTVLTAAHCFNVGPTSVSFVLNNEPDYSQSYSASSWTTHPNYAAGVIDTRDIAIVRLSTTPPVTPMPYSFTQAPKDTMFSFVGYGFTAEGSNNYGTKRYGVSHVEHNETYTVWSDTTQSNASMCSGDSGGPLLRSMGTGQRVIGVVKGHLGTCGSSSSYGVRTDTVGYWLHSTAATDVRMDRWNNAVNNLDVNNDGSVAPIDALLVINWLNANGSAAVAEINTTGSFLDVNNDGYISPIDSLLIINWLNSH